MAGRKPILTINEELLAKVKDLAGQGLTKKEIAGCLGIGYTTLMTKQAENQEFREAIKEGQAQGIQKVANALFNNAMDGNITAQIFYLKNRSPEQWRDRREVATEDITKKPLEMTDREIIEELRSHREEAIGPASKTTH